MSSFTSELISTTDLGAWDYYIFSDNVAIWRALNGLAAWFNNSGQLLQGAALLGSLLLLTIGLYGMSVHKSTINAASLGTWLMFMSMMGITGTANVYNVYTGTNTIVANVPALALVPASVFSKGAYKVFQSMETAFQSTNGSYMSVTQNGFIGPLDVLLALRSPKVKSASPALTLTLTQIVHDCALDPGASTPVMPLNSSLDMLNWFTQYGRQYGLTREYSDSDATGAGVVVGCGQAWTDVNAGFDTFAAGSAPLLKFVNTATNTKNPQDPKGLWGAAELSGSFDLLVGSAIGMNQSAVQFTKNALVASTVSFTMDCLSQSGSISTPENCAVGAVALGDGNSRWQTDAAMGGSGFLKTMFTTMGFLQVLFFALFPVIALYGLIVVNNTAKVFGGYIFFGIWCQSWLLVVAPIQSYIQTSIVDEMTKITSGDSGMTLANSMQVYQSLANKLAVAGDLMASSQMLSLALLSGSMIALSGLAGKWSGSQHMDSEVLQNRLSKPAPLVQNNSANSISTIIDKDGHVSTSNTRFGTGTYSIGSNFTTGSSESHGNAESRANDMTRGSDAVFQAMDKTSTGNAFEQAAAVSHALTAASGFGGTVGTGVAKALGLGAASFLAKSGVTALNPTQQAFIDSSIASAERQAVMALAANSAGFIDKLIGNAGGDAQSEAVGKAVDVGVDILGDLLAAGVGALGVVAVGAEGLSTAVGVPGAAAIPATIIGATVAAGAARALVKGGASAAKEGIMSTIKAGAKDTVKDVAFAAAAKGYGGASAIADAIAGDTKALFQATTRNAMQLTETSTAKITRGKESSIQASEADKLTKAWRGSQTASHERTDSGGQSKITSVTLDKDQIFRIGVNGIGDKSGVQMQEQARQNTNILTAIGTEKENIAAWREVDKATSGRTAADFGGGQKGHDLSQYERNVLFEHFRTGQVSNSLMNSSGGDLLTGVVPTVTKPGHAATNGHWEKAPGSGKPPAPGTKDSTGTALQDWAHVDGDLPANASRVQEAQKLGLRWVPGVAAAPESTTLVRPSENPVDTHVDTSNMGGNLGHSAAYNAALDRFITNGDAEMQAKFENLVPPRLALNQMAPDEVTAFNAKQDESALQIVTIGLVGSLASGLVGSLASGVAAASKKTDGKPPDAAAGSAKSPESPPRSKSADELAKKRAAIRRSTR